MTVFGDAIDTLFEDANITRVAVWRAGGADLSSSIRVIFRQPDRVATFGESRILSPTTVFDVRVAEAPTLAEGDTIEVDGEVYVIQGEPVRDAARLVWIAEAALVST